MPVGQISKREYVTQNMKWSNVKLIFAREVRDQLRDRRTLFTIAVLPVFLYPLLGMIIFQVAQFTRQYPVRVWILGVDQLSDAPKLIDGERFASDLFDFPDELDLLEISLDDQASGGERALRSPEEVERTVRDGVYDAAVVFPPTFADQLTRFREKLAEAQDPEHVELIDEIPGPRIIYDQARDESNVARGRLSRIFFRWREELARDYLIENKIPVVVIRPFEPEETDVAPEQRRRAAIWSKVLPFIVLIWALTGAFYPAIDLCAGEKERGTLETLLSSPAQRSEIVWGKLLTIMIFSTATALLNLGSMGLTGAVMMKQLTEFEQAFPEMPMGFPPAISLAWLIVALIPVSALFSALSLALAALARSAKEGQYYLMPLLLVTMPLMVLPSLPSIQLDLGTSLIPVTGLMLLLRCLMESDYGSTLLYVGPVIGVTGACCFLAIRWAIDQFNNESVLFRESEHLDLGLWLRHLVRDREDTPTVGQALLCAALLLVLRFFVSFQFSMPDNWTQLATLTVVTQIAFFATPALLMAIIVTRSPRKTLLLRMPPLLALPASILLAVLLHPSAIALGTVLQNLYPLPEDVQSLFGSLVIDAPNLWVLLLVIAVTPAICEELAFRGFILSGLRHLGHRWWAILLSSLCFGIVHGIVQQSITATIVGIVIGYLAVHSGSLLTCILFHVTHNALAILSQVFLVQADIVRKIPGGDWIVHLSGDGFTYSWPAVAVTFTLALVLFRWFRRLPHPVYAEERLQAALEHQTVRAPM